MNFWVSTILWEHDKHLENDYATFNTNKCDIYKSEFKFLGHFVNDYGVQANPEIIFEDIDTKISKMQQFFWHYKSTIDHVMINY